MNKLYRSRNNSRLTGLCGGIAEWLGINATFVRFVTVIAALCSFGAVLLIYTLASIVTPKEPFHGGFHDNRYYHYS